MTFHRLAHQLTVKVRKMFSITKAIDTSKDRQPLEFEIGSGEVMHTWRPK
jgi:hypothetical protein